MKARGMAWALRLLLLCGVWGGGSAHAAYGCYLNVTDVGVLYERGNNVRTDAVGTVTISCTRDTATDANTLSYRIGADWGQWYSGGDRRARLGTTNRYLEYTLTKGSAPGAGATCADTNNWTTDIFNPAELMNGTLSFGSSATASATWSFCLRVRGNQGNPWAGLYVDNINIYAQYPAVFSGAITPPATLTYTIGARNVCVLGTAPADMFFSYSSFQPTPQLATQAFNVLCSEGLPWSATITPANGTLLGLSYSLVASPSASTGTGGAQNVTITGTMPAGQQGICTTAACTGSQAHTVTITY